MDLLGKAPFNSDSALENYKWYHSQGMGTEYLVQLVKYIHASDMKYRKEIKNYATRRMGHFYRQEMREKRGKTYEPEI